MVLCHRVELTDTDSQPDHLPCEMGSQRWLSFLHAYDYPPQGVRYNERGSMGAGAATSPLYAVPLPHPFPTWGHSTQDKEMTHMPARSSRWPYIRTLAYKRDRGVNAPCHICGGKIDYFAAPSSTPDSYEPDHLVPVSMAPEKELDLNNIAASHRQCNRRRGNGTDGSVEIGMRSRVW